MSGKSNQSSLFGNGTKTPGPGQYSVGEKMRPKTAGGVMGVKVGSSLAIRPQTTTRVGPGSYNTLDNGGKRYG